MPWDGTQQRNSGEDTTIRDKDCNRSLFWTLSKRTRGFVSISALMKTLCQGDYLGDIDGLLLETQELLEHRFGLLSFHPPRALAHHLPDEEVELPKLLPLSNLFDLFGILVQESLRHRDVFFPGQTLQAQVGLLDDCVYVSFVAVEYHCQELFGRTACDLPLVQILED